LKLFVVRDGDLAEDIVTEDWPSLIVCDNDFAQDIVLEIWTFLKVKTQVFQLNNDNACVLFSS
jgi:hypothetical protein